MAKLNSKWTVAAAACAVLSGLAAASPVAAQDSQDPSSRDFVRVSQEKPVACGLVTGIARGGGILTLKMAGSNGTVGLAVAFSRAEVEGEGVAPGAVVEIYGDRETMESRVAARRIRVLLPADSKRELLAVGRIAAARSADLLVVAPESGAQAAIQGRWADVKPVGAPTVKQLAEGSRVAVYGRIDPETRQTVITEVALLAPAGQR